MSEYFRLVVDPELRGTWFLDTPVTRQGASVDVWAFVTCKEYRAHSCALRLPVGQPGRVPEFTFGALGMPVVTPLLGDRLQSLVPSDVQMIPARADNGTPVSILNVLSCVDCIDDSRTVAERWTPEDGRPEKVGEYHTIVRLIVDPTRINRDIFRVDGWEVAIVVSEWLANTAELMDVDGLTLRSVTETIR